MLMRLLSHVVGLDFSWVADDLLLEFLPLVVMFFLFAWVWFDYKSYRESIPKFIWYAFVLYAVLDVAAVAGWKLFHQEQFFLWNVALFGTVILIAGTRLKKYQFPLVAIIYFTLSWLITP
ncbi:MAG: hypothetical protein J4203_01170 [Candidatus Diapherotrites archaeon]|uniref:Uncharacterized protein n=1 Tax=Candidatus Iainarchaeum sp. TaxID=3101447 RepID=A0A8T4L587_9ARCH|nr:hypothetical protein [Candidatus Diapherotrites archaeon]